MTPITVERKPDMPKNSKEDLESSREGVSSHVNVTTATCNKKSNVEAYSLRTIPVWINANGRKIKVDAVLDDASNETFMNREFAGSCSEQLSGGLQMNAFTDRN